ncbi:MAG: hypothetical protein KDJ38_05215 [Gammaproteobacteria bacterium]|nr:hypothetical protein [Gammaproteobacteria bacterium]
MFAGCFAATLLTLQAAGISLLKPGQLSAGSLPRAPAVTPTTAYITDAGGFSDSSTVLTRIDRTPLFFEQNIGQENDDIVFTSITPNYRLALTRSAADLTLKPKADTPEQPQTSTYQQIRIQPLGINNNSEIVGLNRLQSTSSYFNSARPSEWLRGAAHFSGVKYKNIYQDIDLEYYGNRQRIEYDFIVKAGADPSVIQLSLTALTK